jgi:hypothetical protein
MLIGSDCGRTWANVPGRSQDEIVRSKSFAPVYSGIRPAHCAALGPGSELVVLVFEQDVERGERSVTAGDILLQVELVGIAEDNKDTWMLLVSLLDEGASLYGLC